MHNVFSAAFPMWGLVVIGFLVGRYNVIGPKADEVLSRYIFYCSMPAFLFLSLLKRDILDAFQIGFLICFAVSTAVSMAVSAIAAVGTLRLTKAEIPLFLMNTSYVNSINLGVPLLIYTVGDALPVVIINIFQLLVVSPVLIFLMEQGHKNMTAIGTTRQSIAILFRNPIIIATAAGFVGSVTHWRPPTLVEDALALLGQAAIPTALFALGLTLAKFSPHALRTIARDLQIALPIKLMLQPMVAGVIGYFVIDLEPRWLIAAVLVAGLPTPQNVCYLRAKIPSLHSRISWHRIFLKLAIHGNSLHSRPASQMGWLGVPKLSTLAVGRCRMANSGYSPSMKPDADPTR